MLPSNGEHRTPKQLELDSFALLLAHIMDTQILEHARNPDDNVPLAILGEVGLLFTPGPSSPGSTQSRLPYSSMCDVEELLHGYLRASAQGLPTDQSDARADRFRTAVESLHDLADECSLLSEQDDMWVAFEETYGIPVSGDPYSALPPPSTGRRRVYIFDAFSSGHKSLFYHKYDRTSRTAAGAPASPTSTPDIGTLVHYKAAGMTRIGVVEPHPETGKRCIAALRCSSAGGRERHAMSAFASVYVNSLPLPAPSAATSV